MKELSKKEVKQIRKLLKDGMDVPQICKQFDIEPEHWRDMVIKYDLF